MMPYTIPLFSRYATPYLPPFSVANTPVGLGAILVLESSDFDASGNGSHISTWYDKSASHYDFSGWNGWTQYPEVDRTNTANGHATISFVEYVPGSQYSAFNIGKFNLSGFAGMEIFMVGRHNSTTLGGFHGASFLFNQEGAFSSHHPYSDNGFYENFGTANRIAFGAPPVDFTSGFHLYNITSKSDGTDYRAYMDLSSYYTSTSITYGFQQPYRNEFYIGTSYYQGNGGYFPWIGNMACLYLFNRQLTSGERDQMRAYCRNTWGTST